MTQRKLTVLYLLNILETVVSLVVKLLKDPINKNGLLWQICSHINQIFKIVELVKSIEATGALLS